MLAVSLIMVSFIIGGWLLARARVRAEQEEDQAELELRLVRY